MKKQSNLEKEIYMKISLYTPNIFHVREEVMFIKDTFSCKN